MCFIIRFTLLLLLLLFALSLSSKMHISRRDCIRARKCRTVQNLSANCNEWGETTTTTTSTNSTETAAVAASVHCEKTTRKCIQLSAVILVLLLQYDCCCWAFDEDPTETANQQQRNNKGTKTKLKPPTTKAECSLHLLLWLPPFQAPEIKTRAPEAAAAAVKVQLISPSQRQLFVETQPNSNFNRRKLILSSLSFLCTNESELFFSL